LETVRIIKRERKIFFSFLPERKREGKIVTLSQPISPGNYVTDRQKVSHAKLKKLKHAAAFEKRRQNL
jgi:hypothetical protein